MNKRLVVTTVLTALLSQPALGNVEHSIGVARGEKSGDIHYIEHHQYLENGDHVIEYYSPALDTLMRKQLSYPALPQHPRIEQQNYVKEQRTLVEPVDGQFRMVVEENGNETVNFVNRDPNVVCDAGFDTFIKSEWNRLLERGETDLDFAIAGRGSTLAMRMRATPADENRTRFTIEPKNLFVKVFLPTIELVYRNDDRKLMQYHGMSNLSTADGDRKVNITFEHHTTEQSLERPLARWLPEEIETRQLARAN